MKTLIAALVLAPTISASAQSPDPMAVNPITETARMFLAEHTDSIGKAATLMPEAKYTYHPTPAQMTFAALMQHVAKTNVRLCSAIAGTAAPASTSPQSAPKAALVAAVTESFKTCQSALAKLTDKQLTEMVEIGGDSVPRGYVLMTIV